MIDALNIIAERRISQAIKEGKLDPGDWKGRPLPVDNTGNIPADLRMAYKVLKNAGFLPPEIETRKEIQRLEELIAANDDEHTRVKQLKKLDLLVMKLNAGRVVPVSLEENEYYYRKVVEKISVR